MKERILAEYIELFKLVDELTNNADGFDHSLLLFAANMCENSGYPEQAGRLREMDQRGRNLVRTEPKRP